jgi:DNA repair protein RAD51
VDSIYFTPTRQLASVKGMTEKKVETAKIAAKKMLGVSTFMKASVHLEDRKNVVKLSTGSTAVDAILRGGIETGSITEIFGEFRCGKTQLCHTLAVTCQLAIDSGGAGAKVLYLDSEGTFRPERLAEIAQRWNLDEQTVLNNVVYARAYNSEHQSEILRESCAILQQARYGLVIVDSVTALFRTDYSGRGELAERQQALGKFLRMLQRMADEFGVAIVLTNQVQAEVGGNPFMGGPQYKPIGGHILAHAAQTRLSLRKGQAEQRIVKIYDSPSLPEDQATFAIDASGVMDVKEGTGRKRKFGAVEDK